MVDKSSTSGWGKSINLTSARWQITLAHCMIPYGVWVPIPVRMVANSYTPFTLLHFTYLLPRGITGITWAGSAGILRSVSLTAARAVDKYHVELVIYKSVESRDRDAVISWSVIWLLTHGSCLTVSRSVSNQHRLNWWTCLLPAQNDRLRRHLGHEDVWCRFRWSWHCTNIATSHIIINRIKVPHYMFHRNIV